MLCRTVDKGAFLSLSMALFVAPPLHGTLSYSQVSGLWIDHSCASNAAWWDSGLFAVSRALGWLATTRARSLSRKS